MRFEWDEAKAERNRRKHGVDFDEAASVSADPYALVDPDLKHSQSEDRERTLGRSYRSRILLVVSTQRVEGNEEVMRIIGARRATPREAKQYVEHVKRITRGGHA